MMAVSERTLSEFLQHSGRVLPDLAEGEVLLHRRDGEDLVLMTRRQSEALSTVLQAYFALSSGDGAAIRTVLPWLTFLPAEDQATCLRELREVGSAALHSGRLSRLDETLYAWEATGLAAWDAQRRRDMGRGLPEDPIDVARPAR
jgi:hypothetical protein